VHGGGVTRHEGGFFDRLADGLAEVRVASLRFDLRGHGESGGRQEDLTLAGIGNDVRAAIAELATRISPERVSLLGASLSGGVCASLAARHPALVDRLVLINPLLDYKKRFVDEKDYWHNGRIDAAAAERLATDRYIANSPNCWLDAIGPLTAHGPVVAPDLPGSVLGRTASPHRRAPRATPSARFVRAFTRALGLDRVVVHGWSFGGLVAVLFADQAPELVERLVLADPALPFPLSRNSSSPGRPSAGSPSLSARRWHAACSGCWARGSWS